MWAVVEKDQNAFYKRKTKPNDRDTEFVGLTERLLSGQDKNEETLEMTNNRLVIKMTGYSVSVKSHYMSQVIPLDS